MAIPPGTRLGPYEVIAVIGAGGMGEVYRARDLKLQREVALKLLPDAFAADPDRLARFQREATTLAALNHPNIAQVYGIEESQGDGGATRTALVMELVPGGTIEDLLHAQPGATASGLPLSEALAIARQIANALEAAHEQGIVHRDLKPANVKVKPDGTVKVLDFGLAKAVGPEGASGPAADLANSPTLTARMSPGTQMGMILGTAAYMAPEQARGKAVDRRADIWAFGVVLYEMLTGRRAFEGDEISDVLASVLKTEPAWTAIPLETPDSVRRLLRRCLEKDPRKRLSAIGDARLELDDAESTPPVTASTAAVTPIAGATRPSLWARLWPALAAVLVTAAATSAIWKSAAAPAPAELTRMSLLAAPGTDFYPDSTILAISPDGRHLAYVVGTPTTSGGQLWIRSFDDPKPRRIESGEGVRLPFWSPDSTRIAFFSDKKLKVVAASGGRAEPIADAPFGRGGTWAAPDVIVFAPDISGPLQRVRASGGDAAPITTLDAARSQSGHRFPEFLPDGTHFLYAALPAKDGKFDIFVGSTAGGPPVFVGAMESSPLYRDGWLLFGRNGVLAAQAFDLKTFKLVGDPVSLDDEPTVILDPTMSMTAGHVLSASTTGVLAYYSAASQDTVATWLDATGRPIGPLALPRGQYTNLRISPDGARAIFVRSTSRSESALWLVDLVRGGVTPFSTGKGRNDAPVWSPDGKRVVFVSDREGPQNLYVKRVDDGAPETLFYKSGVLFMTPDSWTPDGGSIVIRRLDAQTTYNLLLLPATGEQTPVPLVQGRFRDLAGTVSPNGRWLSFLTEESGRFELYAQPFPNAGPRIALSNGGALFNWWARDSRTLTYTSATRTELLRVAFDPAAGRMETAQHLGTLPPDIVWMDALPDRQKFLALLPERAGPGSVTIVQNWPRALGR